MASKPAGPAATDGLGISRQAVHKASVTAPELTVERTFVLLDTLSGTYRPERLSWDDAKAAAEADAFVTVRRLDEALAEGGLR